MRPYLFALAALAAVAAVPCIGQPSQGEPTRQEIEEAYRSKSGEGGFLIPGLRRETRRIKEIRGWSLKFKRLGEDRRAGILLTRRYRAVARKNTTCAEYRIIDTMPLPPPNPQIGIKPNVTVEPGSVAPCR